MPAPPALRPGPALSTAAGPAQPATGAAATLGLCLLLVWASVAFTLPEVAELAAQLLVAGTVALALWRWRQRSQRGGSALSSPTPPLRPVPISPSPALAALAPLCWLLLAALALQLASWALSHWLHPSLAERSPRLHRLAAWFFLIPVALCSAGRWQRVALCWGCALLALLLLPWTLGQGWQELARGLGGERVDFGLLNAQHTALLFGAALLGVWLVPMPGPARVPAMAACLCGVLLSQTRGVWLALLCGAIAATLVRHRQGHRPRLVVALLALALLAASPLGSGVYERLHSETPGSLQENVRVRLNTWRASVGWIAQRPLFGWGGGGRAAVVQAASGLSDGERERFRHLHNSYLDTLVNWGALGLLLYAALLGWLSRHFWRCWRRGILPAPVFTFWCAFLPYWLVANGFESFVFYQSGSYLFALVAGGCLALCDRQDAPA
ncbi:O-antigen ligase family protein [Parahaliea mediterranea]|uniref:O-antigen ligase family protein n=1 Tax=Parahaliea mediterranea TaxID=651086 RepID=UPI000E2FE158|nr:O-antigen ligase family protein [Parahaliea mediterranea]